MTGGLRVVIGEDYPLMANGLASTFTQFGHQVVAVVGNAQALFDQTAANRPDLVVADVFMPKDDRPLDPDAVIGDAGARAAIRIRTELPGSAVLLLSARVAVEPAMVLARQARDGFGYLLKDRVLDIASFLEKAERVAAGGSAIDPQVIVKLLPATGGALSPREREVLGLVAEGLSNLAIAGRLFLAERTVESHVRAIFTKLDIPESPEAHRRVLAVLRYLDRYRADQQF